MVQSIMSAPPLPSRGTRAPSQKGRPLPSIPPDQVSSPQRVQSVKDRQLPPTPTINNQSVSSRHESLNNASTLGRSGTSRPLPPTPPSEQTISPTLHSVPNGSITSRQQGLPPIPPVSKHTASHSDNSKRPLPPPPVESSISPQSNSSDHLAPPPALPQRKTSVKSRDDNDFEKRFYFHDVKDFPKPDEFEDKPKRYSSKSPQQNTQRRRRKKRTPTQQT